MKNLNALVRKAQFDQVYLLNQRYAMPLPNQAKVGEKLGTFVRKVESVDSGSNGKDWGVDLGYFFSNYGQLEATMDQAVAGLSLMAFPLNGSAVKYKPTKRVKKGTVVERKPAVIHTRTFTGDNAIDKIDYIVLFTRDPMRNPTYVQGFSDPRFKGLLPGHELEILAKEQASHEVFDNLPIFTERTPFE